MTTLTVKPEQRTVLELIESCEDAPAWQVAGLIEYLGDQFVRGRVWLMSDTDRRLFVNFLSRAVMAECPIPEDKALIRCTGRVVLIRKIMKHLHGSEYINKNPTAGADSRPMANTCIDLIADGLLTAHRDRSDRDSQIILEFLERCYADVMGPLWYGWPPRVSELEDAGRLSRIAEALVRAGHYDYLRLRRLTQAIPFLRDKLTRYDVDLSENLDHITVIKRCREALAGIGITKYIDRDAAETLLFLEACALATE